MTDKRKLYALLVAATMLCVAIAPLYSPLPITNQAKSTRNPATPPPQTAWNKTYGGTGDDAAWSVQQTSDGGYIAAGYTASFGAASNNFWLVKTDGNGNMQWNKTYGGAVGCRAYSVQQTLDGGYVVAGWTSNLSAGGIQFWLVKTDGSGNQQWNKTYGQADGYSRAYSVQQTFDGGYIIAGGKLSFVASGLDLWLVKVDACGNVQWNKTYGGTGDDAAWSAQQTSDGGYIAAGYTESFGAGYYDFWLVRVDAYGNLQWNSTYGGAGYDCAYSIHQTFDCGYIVAGVLDSFGAGGYDFWLVKTDGNGNMQWNKTYGGTGDDAAWSAQQTSDGGYIAAGYTASFGAGGLDFWLVKSDSNGNHQWNKTYGGTGDDSAHPVRETPDGGYILAGQTNSFGAGGLDFWLVKTQDGTPASKILDLVASAPTSNSMMLAWTAPGDNGMSGDAESYVVKYSTSGPIATLADWDSATTLTQSWTPVKNGTIEIHLVTGLNAATTYWFAVIAYDDVLNYGLVSNSPSATTLSTPLPPSLPQLGWNKTYGGTNYDHAAWIQQTPDGGYIIAGGTQSSGAGYYDFLLIKTDSMGSHIWNRTYGGTDYDRAYSIQQTSDGGYILAGYTGTLDVDTYDIWLLKTDSLGNQEWNKTYGGTKYDFARIVRQTSDGGYIVVGDTRSFGAGYQDLWLIKTDSMGNHEWNKTYGGTESEYGFSVLQMSDGGYIVAGSTASFGASPGLADYWLLKTDGNGNHQWNKTYGGSAIDYPPCIQQASDGGFILGGFTESFGAGSRDVWLVKTDSMGNHQWNRTYGRAGSDEASFVQQTTDGGYVIIGHTECEPFGYGTSDFLLLKTDDEGNQQWNKTYGGTGYEMAQYGQQTRDGGYVLAGFTESFGAGMYDVWVVKTKDQAPPSALTDLAVSSVAANSITLSWTSPGDDGNQGIATGYVLKYSSSGAITDANWDSSATYAQSWTPTENGTKETRVIVGLGSDTTYWFAMKAYDDSTPPHIAEISNCLGAKTLETAPPEAITDLAVSDQTSTSVILTWTAPGDDGMQGNATGYVVKYSTIGTITAGSWNSATLYPQSWTPAKNGTSEVHIISGLDFGTTYWFAIKAYDESFNYGEVSNSPGATTSAVLSTTPPGFFGQWGIAIWTDALNVNCTGLPSQPSATGAPPAGLMPFVYFEMQGNLAPGSHVAVVHLYYSIAKVSELGLDEGSLVLCAWNSTSSAWEKVATRYVATNATHGLLVAYLDHFSYFAVFGAMPVSGGMPVILVVAGGIGAAAAVLAVIAIARMRKK